jgi:hypothetical protein
MEPEINDIVPLTTPDSATRCVRKLATYGGAIAAFVAMRSLAQRNGREYVLLCVRFRSLSGFAITGQCNRTDGLRRNEVLKVRTIWAVSNETARLTSKFYRYRYNPLS